MTSNINKWQDGDVIGLVDIGSYNITILIVQMFYSQQKMKILAMDHAGIAAFVKQGGKIADGALLEMIYRIEEKYDLHVDSVAISVGNGYLKFKNIQCGFKFSYSIDINQSHISKIEQYCIQRKNMMFNDIMIDLFNNYYGLDMGITVSDPINLHALSILGNYSIIYANQNIINKINSFVLQNKLKVMAFVSTAHSAALATMLPENKSGVCAVISIGHSDTSVTMFENGYIKSVEHFNLGGLDINKELIKIFGLSIKDAENIKILASNISLNDDYVLSADNFSSLSGQQNIRVSDIYQIIYLKVKEIFNTINKKDKFSNVETIVLTGGVANMPHIEDIAKMIFKKYCRVGNSCNQDWIVNNQQDWHNAILKSTNYTTVIGLGSYLLKRYKQNNLSHHNNYIINKFYQFTSFIQELFY